MRIPAWAVAAAIIIDERDNQQCHYEWLAKRVQKTGISGLGSKGKTPDRTLRVLLSTHRIDGVKLFDQCGDGDYSICDLKFANRLPKVIAAKEALQRFHKQELNV